MEWIFLAHFCWPVFMTGSLELLLLGSQRVNDVCVCVCVCKFFYDCFALIVVFCSRFLISGMMTNFLVVWCVIENYLYCIYHLPVLNVRHCLCWLYCSFKKFEKMWLKDAISCLHISVFFFSSHTVSFARCWPLFYLYINVKRCIKFLKFVILLKLITDDYYF